MESAFQKPGFLHFPKGRSDRITRDPKRGGCSELQRDVAHTQGREPISLSLGTTFSKDSDPGQVSSQKQEKQATGWTDETPSPHPTLAPVCGCREKRQGESKDAHREAAPALASLKPLEHA